MSKLKFLISTMLAIACHAALAQVLYRMRPLGILNGCHPDVTAFNNFDQAAGEICASQGISDAFAWKHDGTPLMDLGPNQAGFSSVVTAINASGVVAGYAYGETQFTFVASGDGTPMKKFYDTFGGSQMAALDMNDLGQLTGSATTTADNATTHAFVWKNNGSTVRDLGTLGGDSSVGTAINATGQVAGYADLPGSASRHAFVWKNDGTTIHDLGTLGGASSAAYFINAAGQVAGASVMPGPGKTEHAFFWPNDGTPMKDLGTLGGTTSVAVALNDAGQIAGNSSTGVGNGQDPFVWLNNGRPMIDLGSLGRSGADARDLNASGQVTGRATATSGASHAFLWRNDGTKMQDLNKLIDPRDPLKRYVTLSAGNFINDRGDVMALGRDSRDGSSAFYLLRGTVIRLTPRSLAFGDQASNTTSTAKSVTVTNTSSKVVPFTGTFLTGPADGQYVMSDSCGASLTGHASCTIQVRFRPTSKGAKYGFLKVNGGEGGLLLVHLRGNGI